MPGPTPNPKLGKRKSMNGKEKAKRRPKKPKADLSAIQFPSELPEPMKSIVIGMNGTDVREVGRKSLTFTDLSTNHNRLTIPTGSAPDFLTPEEKDVLEAHSKIKRPQKRPKNIVLVIDPLGNVYDSNFRKWTMGSDSYAWTTCWNGLVAANGLKEEDVIQVWTFRNGSGERCFVIVVVTRKEGDPSPSESQNCEASSSGIKDGEASTSGVTNSEAPSSNESEGIIIDEEKHKDDETMAAAEETSETTTQPMGTDK
ncbi:PREDICTED: putative B3 domain-containing protein At3g49610 [Tarenaya hassleriana]|uniref:putative B3 domain-containing protein At3g49610 n=1 Tax=Tarenaya hassleriana TaxID=28532 RepID=UPI00053C8029|nr:PREDICTED: putative B3 domain-containing protein At3g49610 [Tarenaya hassleriana]